jgi:hypothetical protein
MLSASDARLAHTIKVNFVGLPAAATSVSQSPLGILGLGPALANGIELGVAVGADGDAGRDVENGVGVDELVGHFSYSP